jgi:alkanesulfonate monooxygenase SsuD/methylene tetrahydromethanopterin reductase-like flavin-dependent oxidoreductase (luciferase family)
MEDRTMAALGVSFFPQGLRYTTVVTLGKLAEERGFDGVFVVEAGVSNDAMASVEAMALATRRITVATGIVNVYLRHPALLGAGAKAIAELSGGRLILGLGVNNARLISALGLTWGDPRDVLRQTTNGLRKIFAGEAPPGVHTPLQPAAYPIPIHLAGVALETAELAGEIADGLMLYLASAERYQRVVACMQRGAQQAGRSAQDVLVTLLIPTFLSQDLNAARDAARRFLTFYASVPLYTKMFQRSGFDAEVAAITRAVQQEDHAGIAAAISDRLLDAVCLVGPRSRCQEQLAALRAAGVDYPVLAPQAVQEEPFTAAQRLIEAFAP